MQGRRWEGSTYPAPGFLLLFFWLVIKTNTTKLFNALFFVISTNWLIAKLRKDKCTFPTAFFFAFVFLGWEVTKGKLQDLYHAFWNTFQTSGSKARNGVLDDKNRVDTAPTPLET